MGNKTLISSESIAGSRLKIGTISFDALDTVQLLDKVLSCIRLGKGGRIVTPNLHFYYMTNKCPDLIELIDAHELVLCDSQILLNISRAFKLGIPAKLAGSDLLETFLILANNEQLQIAFIGGHERYTQQISQVIQRDFPKIPKVVMLTQRFQDTPNHIEKTEIIAALKSTKPTLVFVGLGFPKQERWSAELAKEMPSSWFLNFGMALNYFQGSFRRSPQILQRLGFEWLWRLVSEPKRLARRYLLEDGPQLVRLLFSIMRSRQKN
jgi:N-acetylglucosaminyldiphosphoundecaprenol N-acetyl-beta-D-mannosaminyltransferase